ncbi:dTMP kinase [Qipengyuania sp. DSG2-2]|uniref:dTMP kinase n=1 Tax=Qipengyuania sp. DGS2-2 TaxID=3349631 RepID=UPI0036D3A2BF
MSRGKFIALEGGEGTGKSTQCRLLAEALAKRGIATDITREPGGTPGAEAIRTMLLDPPGEGWGAQAEALLFAAARSDHVITRIEPSLEAGRWVICDRFVDSSRAYQGGAGGLGDETITALHQIGSRGLRPDCTVLIDVPAEVTAARLAERDAGNSDAIGGRGTEYHAAVRQTFLELAERDPGGFVVIDGDAGPDAVHDRIMAALEPLLAAA